MRRIWGSMSVAVVLSVICPAAHAFTIHGTEFRQIVADQNMYCLVNNPISGVFNYCGSTVNLVAPVTNYYNSTGFYFQIHGNNPDGATTSCTVYDYTLMGTLQWTDTVTVSTAGSFDTGHLLLNNTWSSGDAVAIYCSLPPYANLRGINF